MNDNTAFNQEWVKMQRAFWGVNEQNKEQSDKTFNQWLDNLDAWWHQQDQEKTSASVKHLYQKLRNSSRFFYSFAEPFMHENEEGIDPASVLVNHLETYLQAIEKEQDASHAIKGFWKLPLDLWQQRTGFIGDLPASFNQFANLDSRLDDNRDAQGKADFNNAYEQFHAAMKEYQAAYVGMSLKAAKRLMEKINADTEELTVRQMFDLWIVLFEKHYGEFVRDDTYSELYGNLINNWMHLVQQTEVMIKPWQKSMNLPTRDDVEHLQRENAALKARLAQLQNELHGKA